MPRPCFFFFFFFFLKCEVNRLLNVATLKLALIGVQGQDNRYKERLRVISITIKKK